MKRLLRFIAAAALSSAGLAGVGLLTNAASAVPCGTGLGNDPTVTQGPGCAYVSVGTGSAQGNCTQAVVEDGNPDNEDNVGYAGVSNCGRGHDAAADDGGVAGVVGVSTVNGSACDDRWGTVPAGTSDNTNGGGCYSLEVGGAVVDLDVAELGETVPALDLVPLPVGGDESGDYNNTKRDGQGAATCDFLDTADNFEDFVFTTVFGPGGLNDPFLQDGGPVSVEPFGDPGSETGLVGFPSC